MRPADPGLPFLVRLKVALHGGRQVEVVNPDACTACLRCMTVCPEQAIRVMP
jgi:NAD-dependent dihydropyrimidine dehydrogenase PreA subunit